MNKKGIEMTLETVIFIVLNIFFLMAIFVFVLRTSSGSAVMEEIYAKKISLAIDNMRPGTELNISVSELFSQAEKNKYKGEILITVVFLFLFTIFVWRNPKAKAYLRRLWK